MPRPQKSSESKQLDEKQKQQLKEFKASEMKNKTNRNKINRDEKRSEITHCNTCDKDVLTRGFKRHEESKTHMERIIPSNAKLYCLICNGKYTVLHKADHDKTKKHLKAVREQKQQN